MPDEVNLTIDGISVTVPAGTTILDAARQAGIDIPTICFHEACTPPALCRMCVVEVEGSRVLVPSCVGQVNQGMNVKTDTPRVQRSRRTIMEMLDSSVDLSDAPELLGYIEKYQASPERFPQAEQRTPPIHDDNPMFIRDYEKCILCWRCVQVCADDAQYAYAINYSGRGFETLISTAFDKPLMETTCVFCGQCIGVCPTGALNPKRTWMLEQGKTMDDIIEATRAQRRRKKREAGNTES